MGSVAMLKVLSVPISVHSAIPFSVRQGRTLARMAKAIDGSADEEDAGGINPHLAENFRALMGERTVAQLREEMAKAGLAIGANAIQSAKKGWTGLRLGTLEKFAKFFDSSVTEMISPRDADTNWPFPDLRPDFFKGLSTAQKYEIQGLVRRSILDFRGDDLGGDSDDVPELGRARR